MSYMRVIPRDLFNEGNLLKCYARVYINLETANLRDVKLDHDGAAFDVQQDPGSGSISIENVRLIVKGTAFRLFRPLNSRAEWPLYLVDESNAVDIDVFANDGSFSTEMRDFLQRQCSE